jgi:4-amino-4-deoxy-L-arabinose transferase-like glycosyltransferase
LVVVLAAVLARRFGGGIAVAAASGFAAVGGFYLAVGHLLSTATFDVMLWAAVIVLVAALVDGVDPRWWLGVGLLVGVGMLNKHTIAALVVALIFGLVLT